MRIDGHSLLRDLRTNLKPRELFYWLIGNGVYWAFRLTMHVECYGLAEHYGPPAPATLILSGHKRDWDPIMFAAYSYYYRGWLAPDGRRHGFSGRSDIWEPGFLATVVGYKGWPLWIQRLLDKTNIATIATLMRGYPILRIPEYTLRQYLRAVLKDEGNLSLKDVLSEDTLLRFVRRAEALRTRNKRGESREPAPGGLVAQDQDTAGSAVSLRVSDALGWEYHALTNQPIRERYLAPGRYQRLRERLHSLVDQQLEAIARSLDTGDSLWFAPEGAVTLDGRVMRLRSGLHTLLARARPDVRCLPANITYDFMSARRRMTACIGVGPELAGLRDLDRAEQARRVATAIARQTVVTMSMLGSARLLALLAEEREHFDPQAEVPRLAAEARNLASQGAWVQRDLLSERGLRQRLSSFLAYAVKHGLLIPAGKGMYHIVSQPILHTRSSTFWENPVRYAANELAALQSALQEASPPTPAILMEESAQQSGG